MQNIFSKCTILLVIGFLFINRHNYLQTNSGGAFLGIICIILSRTEFGHCKLLFSVTQEANSTVAGDTPLRAAPQLSQPDRGETHPRVKKAIRKKEARLSPQTAMKVKLRQLLANITDTLSEMNWYFTPDQVDTLGINPRMKENKLTKRVTDDRKYNKNEHEDKRDKFLDSFIQQVYKVNPNVLEKLRNRIDKQISVKRQVRQPKKENADLYMDEMNQYRLQQTPFRVMVCPRKAILRSVSLKDAIPYYNENSDYFFRDDANLIYDYDNINPPSTLKVVPSGESVSTTPTTSSTTYESFYDYADYYKDDNYDDISDIADYDINKFDVEYSTSENEGYYATKYDKLRYKKMLEKQKMEKNKITTTNPRKNSLLYEEKASSLK